MDPDLEWANDLNAVTNRALHEAEQHGLLAMDSLHIAAALLLGADELITDGEDRQADVSSASREDN